MCSMICGMEVRSYSTCGGVRPNPRTPAGGNLVQLTARSSTSGDSTRGNRTPCAPQSSARAQRVLQLAHAHNRAESDPHSDAAQILERLQIEASVLAIEEGPLKAGGRQNLHNLRRTKLRKAA